jgi:ABC-type bacteriocin/lantibiotic exporter with double-glycine peptidase domain
VYYELSNCNTSEYLWTDTCHFFFDRFELTSRVSSVSRAWSKKLWKPFIAGGVILVVMLALIIIWVQLIRIVAVFIGIFVVYAIITLAVAIIWIIFGARLRKTLEANTAKVQKNSKVFRKVRTDSIT